MIRDFRKTCAVSLRAGRHCLLPLLLTVSLAKAGTNYVDTTLDCSAQSGDSGCAPTLGVGPFHTLGYAVYGYSLAHDGFGGVRPGDTLRVFGGRYDEPITLSRPMQIRADYGGPVTIGPTGLWPFDLMPQGVDLNGLPLNPKWAQQITAPGSLPTFDSGCRGNISDCCLDATCGSDCHLLYDSLPGCTHQPTIVEKGALCPGSLFGIGHVNWFAATYVGTNFWVGHSCPSCDSDYQFMFQTVNGGGYTANDSRDEINHGYPTIVCTPGTLNCYAIECEFDAGETIDHFDNRLYNDCGTLNWWNFFKTEVDADGCLGCIPDCPFDKYSSECGSSGPYPGGYYATQFLNNGHPALAIVTGLMSLDCAHSCNSELHPVYAMAMNAAPPGVVGYGAKSNNSDDLWVFFVRNSGNQGYCGNSNHHGLELPNNTYQVLLPWLAGMKSVSIICQSWHPTNTQQPAPLVAPMPNVGVLVTFYLDSPSNGSMWDGQLELQWSAQ